jgi:hypothetical protein
MTSRPMERPLLIIDFLLLVLRLRDLKRLEDVLPLTLIIDRRDWNLPSLVEEIREFLLQLGHIDGTDEGAATIECFEVLGERLGY